MRLRKARKMSARALSKALGVSEAYIYRWEHDSKYRPNREVLERVAELLQVSPHERKRLFQLAAARDAPATAKSLYETPPDSDETLLEALLEVDHDADFPNSPADAQTAQGEPFVRAVACHLAYIAATASLLEHPRNNGRDQFWHALEPVRALPPLHPYALKWPKELVEFGVVPSPDNRGTSLDIPDSILDRTFVGLLSRPEVASLPPNQRSRWFGNPMARLYRAMLFYQADHARALCSLLKRWSFSYISDDILRLGLCFRDSDLDRFLGFDDVSCEVVWRYCERSTANYLWIGHAISHGDPHAHRNPWTCEWKAIDWLVLMTVVWTLTHARQLRDPAAPMRDAVFAMQTPAWPAIQSAIRSQFEVTWRGEPDLEREMVYGRLDDDMEDRLRTNPWLIAGIPSDILVASLTRLHYTQVKQPDGSLVYERPGPESLRTARDISQQFTAETVGRGVRQHFRERVATSVPDPLASAQEHIATRPKQHETFAELTSAAVREKGFDSGERDDQQISPESPKPSAKPKPRAGKKTAKRKTAKKRKRKPKGK